MPSIQTLGAAVAGLIAVASALPAAPLLSANQMELHGLSRRQNAAAAAAGLTDIDILQFALTLEWLEGTFYQQGFAKFPQADFLALGLSQQEVDDLINIGNSENAHISLLQSSIAQAGFKPVQPCQYNFGFTDAKGMVGTAAVLENVGVSAYLGAAQLVSDGGILTTAGSILTVEARHQSFIRIASKVAAAPGPFDTPLSARQVFSLAAPFITSCPDGSNLAITAFPALSMAAGASAAAVGAGSELKLQSTGSATAQFCAFTNGGLPGGTAFTAFAEATGCMVPQGLTGISYVNLVSASPASGKITDDIIVAGPMVMQAS